jgi:hypothetical protein
MSQTELSQWRKSTRTLSAMAITITPPITLMPTASGSARLTGSLMSANTLRCWARGRSAHAFRTGGRSGRLERRRHQRARGSDASSDPHILSHTITLKTLGPEAGVLDSTP